MLDFYLLLTPIFALLALAALINLKFALAQPKHSDLSKYQPKTLLTQLNSKQDTNHSNSQNPKSYFQVLNYLLNNSTLIQICIIRKSSNKIPLFLAIAALGLSSIFIKGFMVFFCSGIGILISMLYFLVKIFSESKVKDQKEQEIYMQTNNQKKKGKIEQKNGQKLEIILTSITLLAYLAIIWNFYKNTNNSEIISFATNFLIIFSIDNFVLKPLILSLVAFPLHFWAFAHEFIEKQNQIIQILRGQRVLKTAKRKVFALNKVNNTTSNTENVIEIQPCVNFDLQGNNLIRSSNQIKETSKCSFNYKKSQKMEESQSSLVKYINYPYKSFQPNAVGLKACNLRKIQLDEKVINESRASKEPVESSSIRRKRNKLYSEKGGSIPEFSYDENGLPKNIENQEQVNHSHLQNEIVNPLSYLSAKKSANSRQNESAKKDSENKVHRLSIQRKTLYHSNQRPNSNVEPQNFHNSCVSGFNYTTKNDLLKIREDKVGQDLEEIDMNSPERRKNQMRKLHVKASQQRKMSAYQNEENSKIGASKVFKKYSLDPSDQILQRTVQNMNYEMNSAERQKRPDLEDGSNRRRTLNRTSEMNLSRKSDVFGRFSNDSRMVKSVKRTKNNKDPIVRENDENRIPQFVIQDFTCRS